MGKTANEGCEVVLDRRSARTRRALREALAAEISATGDSSRVTVTALCERADVTRRTFYFHYRDIPHLVRSVEADILAELAPYVDAIAQVKLDQLEEAISSFQPCPGVPELLGYFEREKASLAALLGKGGDPAFSKKIEEMVRGRIQARALEGFSAAAIPLFDYYLTYAISAEVGVIVRWLTSAMSESVEEMARIMTALAFIRPGDLYGRPVGFDMTAAANIVLSQELEVSHGR